MKTDLGILMVMASGFIWLFIFRIALSFSLSFVCLSREAWICWIRIGLGHWNWIWGTRITGKRAWAWEIETGTGLDGIELDWITEVALYWLLSAIVFPFFGVTIAAHTYITHSVCRRFRTCLCM